MGFRVYVGFSVYGLSRGFGVVHFVVSSAEDARGAARSVLLALRRSVKTQRRVHLSLVSLTEPILA